MALTTYDIAKIESGAVAVPTRGFPGIHDHVSGVVGQIAQGQMAAIAIVVAEVAKAAGVNGDDKDMLRKAKSAATSAVKSFVAKEDNPFKIESFGGRTFVAHR